MIRTSFFALTVIATAVAAIAAVAPSREDFAPGRRNLTIIEKNQAFPIYGPIVTEPCAKEDCAEVPS